MTPTFETKGPTCPKCGAARLAGAVDCPTCGILFERYEGARSTGRGAAPLDSGAARTRPDSPPAAMPQVYDGRLPVDAGVRPGRPAIPKTPGPARSRNDNYVKTILVRFGIGFGSFLLLLVVLRFAGYKPAPTSNPPSPTSPAAQAPKWGSTPAPATPPASSALVTGILGFGCAFFVAAFVLYFTFAAFFVWLAALILDLDEKFSKAFGAILRAVAVSIPIAIFCVIGSLHMGPGARLAVLLVGAACGWCLGIKWSYEISFGRAFLTYLLSQVMASIGIAILAVSVYLIFTAGQSTPKAPEAVPSATPHLQD